MLQNKFALTTLGDHVFWSAADGRPKKTSSYLCAWQEPKLLPQPDHHVRPLTQAIVCNLGGGSPVGLAGQQLTLSIRQDPNLTRQEKM